jgi:hypothetical protein
MGGHSKGGRAANLRQLLPREFGEPTMTYHDKIQLTIIIVASPDRVAEGGSKEEG